MSKLSKQEYHAYQEAASRMAASRRPEDLFRDPCDRLELRIEEQATVRAAQDGGAYVESWLWVPDEAMRKVVKEGK